MGKKVTIGGKRLGSGAGVEVWQSHYNRSTNNLSTKFQSSLSAGLLYPAYVNYGLNGDVFEIKCDAFTRTVPTVGPLFGAFKMQVDFFVAPIRLYQGVLHNNPVKIASKMNQVYLPSILLQSEYNPTEENGIVTCKQIDEANLWHYLNQSGLGRKTLNTSPIKRRINNATSLLAYYDIFKQYYANKQEENAWVVTNNTETTELVETNAVIGAIAQYRDGNNILNISWGGYNYTDEDGEYILPTLNETITLQPNDTLRISGANMLDNYVFEAENFIKTSSSETVFTYEYIGEDNFTISAGTNIGYLYTKKYVIVQTNGLHLQEFPLSNIDDMRYELLYTRIGEQIKLEEICENKGLQLPYLASSLADVEKSSYNLLTPNAGLVCKTYQSDLFTNWIASEIIDGPNGIAELTKIDTSDGLYMDQLNLTTKTYELFNRIAASDGTYEGWQEAVYTDKRIKQCESPMYYGGYSAEIKFEEIVATAATNTEQDGYQPLGSMGGRGLQVEDKGGTIRIEIDEPSVIMAIVSLTPRVVYSQGNAWYNTELQTLDDFHKPALDGIGYQDLIVEQMAYWDTLLDEQGNVVSRNSAGKVPAWSNYRTDVDRCHGDFAKEDGLGYMVLNRNYEKEIANGYLMPPKDITTYVDPTKYNYAFAYTELDAQNFWTQINFKIEKRGLISAAEIPSV